MNIFRWGTHILESASPIGLIIGGTALVISFPLIRKGLRCLAVTTAKGVYSVIEEAKQQTSPSHSVEKEA